MNRMGNNVKLMDVFRNIEVHLNDKVLKYVNKISINIDAEDKEFPLTINIVRLEPKKSVVEEYIIKPSNSYIESGLRNNYLRIYASVLHIKKNIIEDNKDEIKDTN